MREVGWPTDLSGVMPASPLADSVGRGQHRLHVVVVVRAAADIAGHAGANFIARRVRDCAFSRALALINWPEVQ